MVWPGLYNSAGWGVGVRLKDGTLIIGSLWSDDDGILAESEQGMRAALGEKGVAGFSRDNRARYHGKKKGKEGKVIVISL